MWKDSETELDLLDFDYLIEITKDIINNKDLSPCSIGIYGNWGSRKSSLMEMIEKDLSKNKDVLCLKFNGWLFEGYDDAKSSLMISIVNAIEENRTLEGKAKTLVSNLIKNINFFKVASKGVKYGLDYMLTGGLGMAADLTMQTVLSKTKEFGKEIKSEDIEQTISTLSDSRLLKENISDFQNDFKELLSLTKIENLVVFIDELDRCSHETILDTLEVMRLFLFAEGTSFVIGADERQIMYAIKRKFPDHHDQGIDIGKEYLEKLIQYPIKIPQLSGQEVEFYITSLQFQRILDDAEYEKLMSFIRSEKKANFLNYRISYETIDANLPKIAKKVKSVIALSKQISSVLAQQLRGNPRHCKRFLNSLSMRMKMSDYKSLDINERILAKIMILEYFKPELYREIGVLQSNENGLPTEVNLWENEKLEDLIKLQVWKSDDWVNNWFRTEPKLGQVNLQPYYHMTRESLDSSAQFGNTNFSNQVLKIIEDLSSGSDVKKNSAIEESKTRSPFERIEILKFLIKQIESSSEIDDFKFKTILEFSQEFNQLHSETLSYLKRIPSKQVGFSMIPRVEAFAKKINKATEIAEILKIWSKENIALSKFITPSKK